MYAKPKKIMYICFTLTISEVLLDGHGIEIGTCTSMVLAAMTGNGLKEKLEVSCGVAAVDENEVYCLLASLPPAPPRSGSGLKEQLDASC